MYRYHVLMRNDGYHWYTVDADTYEEAVAQIVVLRPDARVVRVERER